MSPTKTMVIVSDYQLVENREQHFFYVKSLEQSLCPCCMGQLSVVGSRNRILIDEAGIRFVLRIRRLRCESCKRIHHELPEGVVPFKRYAALVIEGVVEGSGDSCTPAEESTMTRWKQWFRVWIDYFIGTVMMIQRTYLKSSVAMKPDCPMSKLERLRMLLGSKDIWLKKLVRMLVNFNFWPQTRFA